MNRQGIDFPSTSSQNLIFLPYSLLLVFTVVSFTRKIIGCNRTSISMMSIKSRSHYTSSRVQSGKVGRQNGRSCIIENKSLLYECHSSTKVTKVCSDKVMSKYIYILPYVSPGLDDGGSSETPIFRRGLWDYMKGIYNQYKGVNSGDGLRRSY